MMASSDSEFSETWTQGLCISTRPSHVSWLVDFLSRAVHKDLPNFAGHVTLLPLVDERLPQV